MSNPGPYTTGADAYWRAGWRGIVPLPYKKKKNPPSGFTGQDGVDPSYADLDAWATGSEGSGNIALRMPRNIIGVDVDAYGDKLGKQTLADAENQHGPLPPTWRTTSRDDGISGIRLYRIPEGLSWPGEIGHGTELIQHRHRYALVWPSVHPEGRTYRWINPGGVVTTGVPDVDSLPALPDAWVQAYTGGELAPTTVRGTADAIAMAAWLTGLPGARGPLCHRMEAVTDQMRVGLAGSAHNSARDAALAAIRLASEDHHGLLPALENMRAMFVKDATSADRALLHKAQRTDGEAAKEWADLVTSAANLVTANPSGVKTCDCYGQITGLITGNQKPDTAGNLALDSTPEPQTVEAAETTPDPAEAPSRLKDGAVFILDAPQQVPAIWGKDDEVYWATGEALMIAGPPGVGKTTLTGQLVRGLLGLDHAVLGMHVVPATGRILYLAMDRPAQIARALRRSFHESERGTLADGLRVWEGPPPGDIAKHTDLIVTLAHLAGATTVILDSLKDAAIGLTEDEVGAGYNRARQTALADGIQILELHHMVKRGPNGSKPNTLADVYGSGWLTAGCGSVLMLWGAAGDPLVEAVHLKQPAAEVGPFTLLHDHVAGTTEITRGADITIVVAAAGTTGVTAKAMASALFSTDAPTPAEIKKAARKMNALCAGLDAILECVKGSSGGLGGGLSSHWRMLEKRGRSVDAAPSDNDPERLRRPRSVNALSSNDVENGERRLRPGQGVPQTHPPCKGGVGDARFPTLEIRGSVMIDTTTGEVIE